MRLFFLNIYSAGTDRAWSWAEVDAGHPLSGGGLHRQGMQEMRSLKTTAPIVALAMLGWASLASGDPVTCDPYVEDGDQGPAASDLSGVTVEACAGFYEGNEVSKNNPASRAVVNGVLSSWGLGPVTGWEDHYDTDSGTIDFGQMLYGMTVVAFHWGNFDNGQPCDDTGPSACNRNVSALYLFDAGDGVDSFTLLFTRGLSNATLWLTGEPPKDVPEPGTLALLGLGLVGLGLGTRRRRQG